MLKVETQKAAKEAARKKLRKAATSIIANGRIQSL